MGKCGRIRRYMTNRAYFILYPWSCNRVVKPKNKISKETVRSCYFLGARKFDTAAKTSTVLKNRKHVSIIKAPKLIELKNTDMIYKHLWKSRTSFIFFFTGWRTTRLLTRELWLLQTAHNKTGPNDERDCHLHDVVPARLTCCCKTALYHDTLKSWSSLSAAATQLAGKKHTHTHIVINLVSSRHTLTDWFNFYLPLQACALQLRCPPCTSLI